MDDETQTYPVLSNVRHNGTLYAPDTENDKIDLTEKQHASLKAIGCVGDALGDDDDADLTDAQTAEVKTAFSALEADKDFTKDGNPKAAAINALIDFDISADQIKVLWAEFNTAENE